MAIVALAVGVRVLLDPWLEAQRPLGTLYAAVAAAALIGGIGTGLAMAVVGHGTARRAGSEREAREREALERGKLESELESARLRSQAIVESIGDSFYVLDLEWRFSHVNAHYERFSGKSRGELLGRKFWEVFPELIGTEAEQQLRRAHESSVAVHYEMQSPGTHRWLEVLAYPSVDGLSVFLRDVTDRVRAVRTIRTLLRISEKLNANLDLDLLLDALVQEAIPLMGAEGGIAGLHTPHGMMSHRYFRHGEALPLEYCWAPLHGFAGWLIVHKVPYLTNDVSRDPQMVRELCERFGITSALSIPILDSQRDVLGFFEMHNKRGGFSKGDEELLVAVAQIAGVAMQNALVYRKAQQVEEALKQADRRKNEFLATLSHELRSPLAPIRNAVELMRAQGLDEAGRQYARGVIERQMQQMVRLVDDLLEVSRITRGKLELRRQPMDLSSALLGAVETTGPLLESLGHRVAVTLPAEPILIEADETRLAQILSNLLHNAAKYTDPGGRIEMSAEHKPGEAVIRVRDTGIGIEPEHLPHVFDMFSQVTPALERSQGGLGIGLALARNLVELHGGRLEAHSDGLGKGSEFVVTLPVPAALAPPFAASEPEVAAPPTRRVLVIDDNHDTAESLAVVLRMFRHEVQIGYDGEQALESAAAFRPEVALLDIGLPKLNGYEVARRLREREEGRSIMLVAITGWGQEEERQRAMEAGFDHHLTKPVDPAALQRLITATSRPTTTRPEPFSVAGSS